MCLLTDGNKLVSSIAGLGVYKLPKQTQLRCWLPAHFGNELVMSSLLAHFGNELDKMCW